jgi:hypothetical protein
MRPPLKAPINPPPSPLSNEEWQELIRQSASALPYPATPNVVDPVRVRLANARRQGPARRLQPLWVASIILALLVGLWAVPPVRAAILEFFQIGAVRIWLVEPTPTPLPTNVPSEALSGVTASSTSRPTPTPLRSLFNLAGETTLAEAEAKAGFPIPLPTYPSDLGPPDRVFFQEMSGPVVVLLWMNPEHPDKAEYSLHIFSNGAVANKMNPSVVMTTTVGDSPAVWTNGPYLLVYGEGSESEWETRYLVSGRVLIWVEGTLTYRLESNLNLEEAVRMAESLE